MHINYRKYMEMELPKARSIPMQYKELLETSLEVLS